MLCELRCKPPMALERRVIEVSSARLQTCSFWPPTPTGPDRRRETRNLTGEYDAGVIAKFVTRPHSRKGLRCAVASLAVLSFAASGITSQLGKGVPAAASTIPECSTRELQTMFIPESPGRGTEGAVFLQNVSSHVCSLSGQPSIRIFNRVGTELNRSESLYRWDPPLPRPRSPILLSSRSSSAVVEWNWCGFDTSYKRIDIEFGGWKRPVEILSSSEAPDFYAAPTCKSASESRLAVDYVRELGPKGISGLAQIVRVVPSGDLHNGEKVTVFVSGFWPEGKFWLSECAEAADVQGPPGCGAQLAAEPFGMAGITGTGTYIFIVQSRAAAKPFTAGKMVSCTDKCVLVATSGAGVTAYTRISFARS